MKADLQATLKSLGIEFTVLENNVLGTDLSIEFEGERVQAFPLALYQWEANDERGYIRLMISPFIRSVGGITFELSKKVLEINNQMPKAKFFLDEDGDLALTIDIAVEELSVDGLKHAFDILGTFADRYFAELEALSN